MGVPRDALRLTRARLYACVVMLLIGGGGGASRSYHYQNVLGPLVKLEADEDKRTKESQVTPGYVHMLLCCL